MAEIKKINTELQLLNKFLDTSGDAGSANQVLVSTTTGINWVDGSGSDIIGGPYLPLAGGTMTGNIDFNDNVRARFGSGDDLQIVHDGSNSYIHNNTGGDLFIRQTVVDRDIRFEADNGVGGRATYLTLDGSTTHAYFSNPGNVGIGTTSPGRPLTINSDNADRAIRILENDSANESWDIGVDVDGDLNFFNSADTSPSVTFLDNGNVGIGTTNPLDPLNVQSTGASDYAFRIFRSTSATQGLAGFYEGSANQGQLYLLKGNNTAGVFLNSDGDSYLNGGNVGIGTTSPALQSGGTGLHINAPTSSEIKFTNSTTGTTASDGTALVASGTAFTINNREAGNLTLGTNNSTRVLIDSSGNVGIGTTNPAVKLQVDGVIRSKGTSANIDVDSLYGAFRFNNGTTFTGGFYNDAVLSSGNAIDLVTYIASGDYYISTTSTSKAVTVKQGGNVGIGTTSPSEKLDVDGSVKVSGNTHTGSLRVDATATGPTPAINQTPSDAIVKPGGDTSIYLSEPEEWLEININGVDYVIPAYLP